MKRHYELITEDKNFGIKDALKILQGDDFGMSESGGNGFAKLVGGDTIKLMYPCSFFEKKRLENLADDWIKGGVYNKYFLSVSVST